MEKISVLIMPVLLMIVAIFCASFSNTIDMAVNGGKQVKKVIVVFSVGVILVCTIAIIASICSSTMP